MGRFKWYALIGGAVLLFMGGREFMLARKTEAEPAKISCAALSKDGPGDNAHVVMSDFVFSLSSFVYEEERHSKAYNKIWVPALPLDGPWHQQLKAYFAMDEAERAKVPEPVPNDFHVIVVSDEVSSDAALAKLADAPTLQGIVVNEIESLSSEEKKLLKQSYPGVDLDKCWILEHKREPKGMMTIALFALAGLGAIGLGIVGFKG